MRKPKYLARKPILGCAFDPDMHNESERVYGYLCELEYYKPRGFTKLYREGNKLHSALVRGDSDDTSQFASEWMDDCDSILTEHAQRCGMDYVSFGPFPHGGAIGYYANTDSAIEDADHIVDDSFRGRNDGELPRGFTGLYVHISDHGNVTAYTCRCGKCREMWGVV